MALNRHTKHMFKADRLVYERERQRDYRIANLVRSKLTSGNGVEVDRCMVTLDEIKQIYGYAGLPLWEHVKQETNNG